jgi:hypothetical protein
MRFRKRAHPVSALFASVLLLAFATAAQAAGQAVAAPTSSGSPALAGANDASGVAAGNGAAATAQGSPPASAVEAQATPTETTGVAGPANAASTPSAAGSASTQVGSEPTPGGSGPATSSPPNAGANDDSGPEANLPTESAATNGGDPGSGSQSAGTQPASTQPASTQPASTQPGNPISSQLDTLPSGPEASAGSAGHAVESGQKASPQLSGGTGSDGSGSGAQNIGAAESNATLQSIAQVEISGCTAYCRGITQVEVAEEANTTVQLLEGALQAASAAQMTAAAGAPAAQTTTTLVQLQIGCLSECFGATTTGSAPLASYQQGLQELLAEITAAVLSLEVTPASDQNATEQTISQRQYGEGSPLEQTEVALEVNTTLQIDELSSALVGDLQAALSSAEATADEAVNQTEQEIWQLQIGCLMFCVETQQDQLAAQSNTTSQTVVQTHGSLPEAAAVEANDTAELVWQVQIGCIYWCVDTTEQQTAPSGYTVLTVPIHAPPATSPPEASPGSPETGIEQKPATAETAGSTSIAAVAGTGSGTVSLPPPSDPVATSATLIRPAVETPLTSGVVGPGQAPQGRSGAATKRPLLRVPSTVTTVVVSSVATDQQRNESSITHIPSSGIYASSPSPASPPSVYKLATQPARELGTRPAPALPQPVHVLGTQPAGAIAGEPEHALRTRAMLGAAITAGEGVVSDTPILVLLAAIVFFVLRLSPRRVRSSA